MAIVVLPRIEQENPFGQLAEVISEQALPFLIKLYANKDKIAKLSDTELTDLVEVLRRHAPELVANGKINWEKVNEWAQSDDPTKLKVATFLFDAKRMREDFANAPLIAKLQIIDAVGSVNHQELNKMFVADKMQQKLSEAIGKSNLPDAYKLLLLANIEKFAEKPHLIPVLEKILSEAGTSLETAKTETTKTETTESGGGTGSWRFSLEGSEPFRIQLEEPQLVLPQISPMQIAKTTTQKPVGTQRTKQPTTTPNQKSDKQPDIPPSAGKTEQSDDRTKQSQSMSNLEKWGWRAVKGLELINSLLAGVGLYALTRNLQAARQAPVLVKGAEKVATETVKRGFSKAREVSSETAKKLTDKVKDIAETGKVVRKKFSGIREAGSETTKKIGMKKDVPKQELQKPTEDAIKKLDDVLKRNEEKLNQIIKQEAERLKELEKQIDKAKGQFTPSQISYLKKTEKTTDELMEIIKKYEEKYGWKGNKAVEETKKSLFDLKALVNRVKTKINIRKVEKELGKELSKDAQTLDDLLKYSSKPKVRDIREIKEAEKKATERLLAEKQKKAEEEAKRISQNLQNRINIKPPKEDKKFSSDRISLKYKKKKKSNK
jgi:hypothetical protein